LGQFYKIQLAYVEQGPNNIDAPGYFSTVGIFKYTAVPQL
jgi:hypothetical protein